MHKRVEICGGIASGKTTLAGLIQPLVRQILFESFEKNPFWEAFYQNPGEYIFETEVTFLLQHYHQIKAEASPEGVTVCDYSFVLDQAYADIGLNGPTYDAFDGVYQTVQNEIGLPDLLIYLECNAEEELHRIRNRGRSTEVSIDRKFLESLNEAVGRRFEELRGNTKTLRIDSTVCDFAHQESERKRVTEKVQSKLSEMEAEHS